ADRGKARVVRGRRRPGRPSPKPYGSKRIGERRRGPDPGRPYRRYGRAVASLSTMWVTYVHRAPPSTGDRKVVSAPPEDHLVASAPANSLVPVAPTLKDALGAHRRVNSSDHRFDQQLSLEILQGQRLRASVLAGVFGI